MTCEGLRRRNVFRFWRGAHPYCAVQLQKKQQPAVLAVVPGALMIDTAVHYVNVSHVSYAFSIYQYYFFMDPSMDPDHEPAKLDKHTPTKTHHTHCNILLLAT